MVPYSIDSIINKKANQASLKSASVSTTEQTIARNKKQFETMNIFYEDGAKGGVSTKTKLENIDNMHSREQTR